jgi:hypothetical protein
LLLLHRQHVVWPVFICWADRGCYIRNTPLPLLCLLKKVYASSA